MPGEQVDASQSETWARVWDELRSQQSLASVINDPLRGSRLLRGQWEGLGEFVETVRESVGELNDQRDDGAIDPATVARIDELIGQVPEVSEFTPYLETFTEEWEVYYKNHRRLHRRGQHQLRAQGSSKSGLPEDEESAAQEAHLSVPLDYFSDSFSLEQHQIFRQPLESAVDMQEEIHSQLSEYMDLVEVSLFEHIRKAQRYRLFDSLADLNEPLQQDLSGSLSVIRSLRGQLKEVQKLQLQCSLEIGKLERRKRRVHDVLQRLDCLEHVRQCRPSIQMLLQGRDFITALDLIDSTTSAFQTNLQGVASATATWNQLEDLGETFDRAVEAEFVHQSTEALLRPAAPSESSGENDVDAEANEVRLRRLCQCLASRNRLRSALNPTLRDVLLSHLKKALKLRARSLLEELGTQASGLEVNEQDEPEAAEENPASSPRQEAEMERSPVAEQTEAQSSQGLRSGEPGGAVAGISAALCALSFDSFLEFWKQLLGLILVMANHMSDYSLRIYSVVEEAKTQQTDETAAKLLLEVIAVELQRLQEVTVMQAFKIAGALLQARKAEHQGLKMVDWNVFLDSTQTMLGQVQKVQQQCYQKMKLGDSSGAVDVHAGLRATMNAQTKSIIEEFHQKCMVQTKQVLEQERWERTDVPVQYRRIVNRLLGVDSLSAPQGDGSQAEEGLTPQSVERYLHVEGTHFLVVPAVLTLIQLLGDYVSLCHDFSDMMAEIVQRMCQLLRLFNMRAQKLVLNGQAVQHKVLPKITAANLALCSQCCAVVMQLLPLLQTRLNEISRSAHGEARGAMVAALLSDLSKIVTEFTEHRTALFGKLSDLLKNAYENHAKRWLGAPHGRQGDPSLFQGEEAVASLQKSESIANGHEALEGLVKDVTAMYRVLLRNLNYDSVRRIFARAFEDIASVFQQRLDQDIAAPSTNYSDGVGCSLGDRLLLDFAYLYTELEKLTGITTPLERLVCDLVQHLLTKLPEDALRRPHPIVLEVLRSSGRLPR